MSNLYVLTYQWLCYWMITNQMYNNQTEKTEQWITKVYYPKGEKIEEWINERRKWPNCE